jgi:hypothetical protein
MNKPDDDGLTLYPNKPGLPILRPQCLLFPYGEPVYRVNGKLAVNLGGGWLAVDLEHKPWEH